MLFRRDGQLGLEAVGQGPGKLAIPIELDGGGCGDTGFNLRMTSSAWRQ